MRILQQCIYFPPEIGGLESHVYYLCRELVRQGHEVTVLTSRSVASSARTEVMDGVRVLRTWFPGKRPSGWIAHTVASMPTHRRLAGEADVLHAQTFASALPSVFDRGRSQPFVLTLHTSHFLRLARKKTWRPVLRWIIKSADWVLAASEEIRDVALDIFEHPHAEALTNGVDTELFRPGPATIDRAGGGARLVVPRRLFEKNGVEYVVRALPLLRAKMEVEVSIVGDGPLRVPLETLARELGVADHIRFMGARPNSEMPGIYASADAVVIPSLMEATSVAALEAMSCGVPVAASDVGGLPEIVDEDVGTLFRPADPEHLAARVAALLSRPDLAALGARARERVVQHWSLERLARRHVEIYQELLP